MGKTNYFDFGDITEQATCNAIQKYFWGITSGFWINKVSYVVPSWRQSVPRICYRRIYEANYIREQLEIRVWIRIYHQYQKSKLHGRGFKYLEKEIKMTIPVSNWNNFFLLALEKSLFKGTFFLKKKNNYNIGLLYMTRVLITLGYWDDFMPFKDR